MLSANDGTAGIHHVIRGFGARCAAISSTMSRPLIPMWNEPPHLHWAFLASSSRRVLSTLRVQVSHHVLWMISSNGPPSLIAWAIWASSNPIARRAAGKRWWSMEEGYVFVSIASQARNARNVSRMSGFAFPATSWSVSAQIASASAVYGIVRQNRIPVLRYLLAPLAVTGLLLTHAPATRAREIFPHGSPAIASLRCS